jgi:hypothetical protein
VVANSWSANRRNGEIRRDRSTERPTNSSAKVSRLYAEATPDGQTTNSRSEHGCGTSFSAKGEKRLLRLRDGWPTGMLDAM